MKKLVVVLTFLTLLPVIGCAHGGVKPATQPVKSVDPVVQAKQDFYSQYYFLITKREKVSYYKKSLGIVDKEEKIFENVRTLSDFDKFAEVFWKIRDTDPSTTENEFKELVDARIGDIKNEVLFRDLQAPGVRFDRNGGLTGDLARVYLLHGEPSYKEKLSDNRYHVELMVWYYVDQDHKHLFRFLFYDKYGSYRLFKNYSTILDFNYWIDPLSSPLRDISVDIVPTVQNLYDLWNSLLYIEDARAFVTALIEFSEYTGDIVIEGGDGKKKFGALDPPDPAALTAERYKPRILGEPGDFSGREIWFGKYRSFVPMYVRITKTLDGNPSLALIILYQNIDWEIKGGKAECKAALNINIINKGTAEAAQFSTALTIELAKAEDAKAIRSVFILVDEANGANSYGSLMKFRDFIKKLPLGSYIMDIDFFDLRTMKSAVALQEFVK